ncbi:MAG: ABC transporter ATP-binding protein [Syntrophales bacterium]|nr:ABC transporter ATP-binding protein [Syntrophales bacterium]
MSNNREISLISIRNLTKTFWKNSVRVDALRGINLDIAKGESLAIHGVSGAGKSTLLHIMGTLERPTTGLMLYNGEDIFKWDDFKLANFRNHRIGFVFQFHNLLPEFTALENAIMPLLIAGYTKKEALMKGHMILEELGLKDRLHHRPGELSGGEQQRVAVARAIVMEPDVILADEPTGNLDTETGKKIEEVLMNLNKTKNITLVVVTHNRSLAELMDKQIGLRDGKILTSEQILD